MDFPKKKGFPVILDLDPNLFFEFFSKFFYYASPKRGFGFLQINTFASDTERSN